MGKRNHFIWIGCLFLFSWGSAFASIGDTDIEISYRSKEAIGQNKGYTSIKAFVPFFSFLSNQKHFLDARAHFFDRGRSAGNIGLVSRYFLGDGEWILGHNIYYDIRDNSRKPFHQLGIGLECLSNCFDVRINGYVPLGPRKSPDSKDYYFYPLGRIAVINNFDFAMGGGDLEVGRHFSVFFANDVRIGVGPYFYRSHYEKSAFGGKIRLSKELSPHMSFEVLASSDRVFKGRIQAEIAIQFPLRRLACKDACSTFSCWGGRPLRNEIIVTKKDCFCSCNYCQ